MISSPADKGPHTAEQGIAVRLGMRMLLVIVAGGGILYLGFSLIFLRPLPDTFSGTYFALRHLSAFLAPFLVFSMLAYFLVVSLGIALLSAYAFHRIAGPLYRMERALENFESGDAVKAVFFREGDGLVSLAQSYNRFVTGLREQRQGWLAAMEHAERLCLQDTDTCKAEMGEALARLSKHLARYR